MPTLAFFKPYGVVSAFTDPLGAPTLAGYISTPGVYAAGRLDTDSEGLLILTDDGRLAARITDPARKLPKTYWVLVERVPDEAALERLRRGVETQGARTRPAQVELLPSEPALPPRPVPVRYRKSVPTAWLEVTLWEGKKRQIRHMTAAVGHPTLRLVRVAIGTITLSGLQPGQARALSAEEVARLMRGK